MSISIQDGTNAGPYSHVADFSAIKELDSITKEIDDIKKDKMQVERDKAQKEADIKIRQGEVQMQQKEFDAMTSTLHQLEHQKKEAQKRLDELDDKKSNLEINVKDMREKCDAEQGEGQEEELSNLKIELNRLRDEEVRLEQTVESSRQQLESLVKSNTDLQIQLKQTKAKVQHLQDQHRALSGSIGGYTSQLNGGDTLSGFSSDIDTLSSRATAGSPVSTISNFSTSGLDDFKEDPFKGKDPFNNSVEQSDPFQNEDPFKGSDPFKSEQFTADPFGSDDPFKNTGFNTVQQNDPFGSSDPFGSAFPSSPAKKKPTDIDGFGGGFGMSPTASKKPSQKKMPPPRPAPPKGRSPAASPMKPKVDPFPGFGSDPFAGNDPFASSTEGGKSDGFANFAEFSPSKFDINDAWSGTSPSKTNSTVSQQLNFTSSTENEETEA
ncbi:hypothetical protein SNE40_012276 [Patella caerulea]|uniref:Epidermal growth factor receptor substrate 15-like 1 n=1 Tax=Patella caerulea TaxID=87958 RepID=A0AAN8PN14_PATCE